MYKAKYTRIVSVWHSMYSGSVNAGVFLTLQNSIKKIKEYIVVMAVVDITFTLKIRKTKDSHMYIHTHTSIN